MLKKRVIPTLLLKDKRMVKGKKFTDFRDVGLPHTAVRIYSAQDADELIFLDISPNPSHNYLLSIINQASVECFMPLTVGGGIRSFEQIQSLMAGGADKIIITSASFTNPAIVKEAVNLYGSQSIIGGIDYRIIDDKIKCYINSGRVSINISFEQHLANLIVLGVGEIFLNCIDYDGMMSGMDTIIASYASSICTKPVVICGGAGDASHLRDILKISGISGVACSSIFHFGDNNPIRLRSYLKNEKIPMRKLK